MPMFEVTVAGKTYDVDAPDHETAAKAAVQVAGFGKGRANDKTGNPVLDYMARENNKRQDRYDASDARRQARKASPVPVFQPVNDAINPGKAAVDAWKEMHANDRARVGKPLPTTAGGWTKAMFDFGPELDLAKAIGATVAAPFASVFNQAVNPAARGLERLGAGDEQENAAGINLALMAARPGLGGAPRIAPPVRQAPIPPSARTLGPRLPPVAEMRTEAATQRAAGTSPSLLDVSGSRGERVLRAVGGKNQAAGEVLERRASATKANTKGAAINSTRRLTPDQRTPTQLAADTRNARGAAAQTDYAPAYAEQVPVTAAAAEALVSETGQTAVRLAMRSARDLPEGQQVVAELEALIQSMREGRPPPATLSGRTLDHVRQQLGDLGGGFQRANQGRRAAGVFERRAQIDNALDAAPGLRPARQAYRESSQAIDVAEGGNFRDPFTTDPNDYAAWVQGLPPQAQAANQVAVRQYLQDWLGGQRTGPLGSLDEIATSPYGTANLRTTFGGGAQPYIDTLEALTRQQRKAAAAAPSGGSRTAPMSNDMDALQGGIEAARIGVNVARGNLIGVADGVLNWVRRMGIGDDLAVEIAQLSSDPARLDEALNLIEAAQGPNARRQLQALVSHMVQGAGRALPVAGAAGASQPGSQ